MHHITVRKAHAREERRRKEKMLPGYINNVEDGVSDPGYDFDEREDE